jgi:tRNA threonylcarbamoyladenosine biosynthesis protein TsaB
MSKCLLALETSGRSGSVALLMAEDGDVDPRQNPTACTLDVEVLDPAYGSAKTLAPAIHKLLARHDLPTSALNAIALIHGPGSFTGLRVGVATAKAMAYALKIPIVAVDGLNVIAHQIATAWANTNTDPHRPPLATQRLMAVVDAYRGQSFCAEFRLELHRSLVEAGSAHPGVVASRNRNTNPTSGIAITVQPTGIADNDRIIERWLEPGASDCLVAGPGVAKLRKHAEAISPSAIEHVRWEATAISLPQAATVATLGWNRWRAGQLEDTWGLLPMYYRSSAAEEKAKSEPLG